MSGAALTRRAAVGLVAALLCAACGVSRGAEDEGAAGAGDTVDGALWRVRLTSRARKDMTRMAVFRASDGVLYQRVEPKPGAEEEAVGKDRMRGKAGEATVLEFENLRVMPPGRRGSVERISGTARITKDEFGKYHGRMVDGDGRHWDVALTRFRE